MNADSIHSLEEARSIIGQQQAEIETLRRQMADNELAGELRQAFSLAATAGAVAAPVEHLRLLEMIVDTAVEVIGARNAALFLIDHEAGDLAFEVATGTAASDVKQFRVPLGQGIAGLVAVTGQPMAVSNVEQDPRHASDIARSVGYMPSSILCVPLLHHGEVIGVLELLDHIDGSSFAPADIQVLGRFADLAAVAIEQSGIVRSLVPLVGRVLQELGLLPPEHVETLRERAGAFARGIESDHEYQQTIELAQLVREIASQGDAECEASRQILEGLAAYLRTRKALTDPFGVAR